ncbi:hypothetical protein FF2_037635 [Malus domestica]
MHIGELPHLNVESVNGSPRQRDFSSQMLTAVRIQRINVMELERLFMGLSNGDFVGAMSMPTPPLISVLALELHAIKKGLELAIDLGCVPLIVELNSLRYVQLINHDEECLVLMVFMLIAFELFSRDANGTTHRLAQFSLQCRALSMWVDTSPWLMALVHAKYVVEV